MINYSFPGLVGRIDRIEAFESRYVIPRIVDIWVPPIYDVEPDTKFAVLYMHDGENLFNPANSKFSHMDWGIDETVTRLMQEKKIRPTIVVGMWSTEKRAIEYMPQKLIESRARNRLYSSMQDEVGGTPVSDLYLKGYQSEWVGWRVLHRFATMREPSPVLHVHTVQPQLPA